MKIKIGEMDATVFCADNRTGCDVVGNYVADIGKSNKTLLYLTWQKDNVVPKLQLNPYELRFHFNNEAPYNLHSVSFDFTVGPLGPDSNTGRVWPTSYTRDIGNAQLDQSVTCAQVAASGLVKFAKSGDTPTATLTFDGLQVQGNIPEANHDEFSPAGG